MGLAKPSLRFIVREHKYKPITGPLLQLGRQTIGLEEAELSALIKEEGLIPAALPQRATPASLDVLFFNLLGIAKVYAMDFSAYEGADFIHDLNQPVDKSLAGRFDFILDGGTTEHVFDIRQSMRNIATMLRPGGRILHMQPTNNYVNHGFYQFSPTFYYDYYSANNFVNLRGFLFEHEAKRPWGGRLYELNPLTKQQQIASGDPLKSMATFFLAEKTAASTADAIPTQSVYADLKSGTSPRPLPKGASAVLKKRVNRALPRPVVRVLQRGITAMGLESSNGEPFFDPTRHRSHPYGQKYLGKLE